MRQISRSLVLALALTPTLFGCSEQPIPEPQQDLGQHECLRPPEVKNPLKNVLHLSCQGINSTTGTYDWIEYPTYAVDQDGVGHINWQPVCVKQTDGYLCAAPPQQWWSSVYLKGEVRCYMRPCHGNDTARIVWADYLTGLIVKPNQSPVSLPMTIRMGQTTPQGGGDGCLNEENGWVFVSQQ